VHYVTSDSWNARHYRGVSQTLFVWQLRQLLRQHDAPLMSVSDGPRVPPADRWPAQVQKAFGFLGKLGFQVIDGGTYRLGDWTLLGNGDAGIHLDSDGGTRTAGLTLIRLDDGRLPARWWDGQMVPRVSLGLSGVTGLLAPGP
jgi:hypothetical protein